MRLVRYQDEDNRLNGISNRGASSRLDSISVGQHYKDFISVGLGLCVFCCDTQTAAELAPEKSSKEKKKKKKKKSKSRIAKDWPHDDECFRCGEGGELVMCDHAKSLCPKAYHLQCLNREKSPHGKWCAKYSKCAMSTLLHI